MFGMYAPIYAGLFGLVVGSFLNVVILRMHTGRTVVRGRSSCMTCGKQLVWWELIPVLSYIFLRGRCSSCRSRISLQYVVIELIVGVLFGLSFFLINPAHIVDVLEVIFVWLQICFLTVLAVYDVRHRVILDGILVALIVLVFSQSALFSIIQGEHFFRDVLWRCFYGVALAAPFYAIWKLSGGRAMGFGDVKFAVVIGILFGNIAGLSAILLAFYIACIWAFCVFCAQRMLPSVRRGYQLHLKSEVPFGPFLSLGVVIVTLTNLGLTWFVPILQLFAFYTLQ